jgi:putative hydrolase of the HAD superfamily
MKTVGVELVLFDAAGTLIEPVRPVGETYSRCFSRHGLEIGEEALGLVFREVFGGMGEPDYGNAPTGDVAEREWWREVVFRTVERAGGGLGDGVVDVVFEELFGHFAEGKAWRVFPEVIGVLERLRGMGVRMAVVSNFDRRLHRVLDEMGMSGWFEEVVTSADVGARKPSPRMIEEVLARAGVGANSSRMTGDSGREDGGAAEAAGVPVFLLDRPGRTLLDFEKWISSEICGK